MSNILLTSTGFSSDNVYKKFSELTKDNNYSKVVIITTASLDKENNQYSQLAKNQLHSLGFSVIDFYDFENDGEKDLSGYDVIYVCGGNTFKLLKFAKECHFEKEIIKLLERGGIYVGVSAGSIIVGPSIKIAEGHDPNDFDLTDLTGLNIVNLIIFPHYKSNDESIIKEFEISNNVSVERISDAEAILLVNGEKILIK